MNKQEFFCFLIYGEKTKTREKFGNEFGVINSEKIN
jgi:hypothetical protein